MALDLHARVTGSSDEGMRKEMENEACILVSRLHFWNPSIPTFRAFDESVRSMLRAVLREFADFEDRAAGIEPGGSGRYADLNAEAEE